jgi:large subunit ribosomal protein L25
METIDLVCEKRATRPKGTVGRLRRQGRVPGVIYGNQSEPVPVALPEVELRSRVDSAARQRLIRIKSDASDLEGKHVIVKELQRTPVDGNILHVDLYEVDLNKPLRVSVQLRFVGRAAGIVDGGILQPLEREIEVECLPLEIPEAIEVDVTRLNVHDVMHVSALNLPGNVKPIFDTDFPIVTVLPPTVAEAPAVAAATAEGAPTAEGAAAKPAEGAGKEPATTAKG